MYFYSRECYFFRSPQPNIGYRDFKRLEKKYQGFTDDLEDGIDEKDVELLPSYYLPVSQKELSKNIKNTNKWLPMGKKFSPISYIKKTSRVIGP